MSEKVTSLDEWIKAHKDVCPWCGAKTAVNKMKPFPLAYAEQYQMVYYCLKCGRILIQPIPKGGT